MLSRQLLLPLRAAIFGNAGSIIACRTGASDAPILPEQVGLGDDDALVDLRNFTAWARLLRDGQPSSPIPFDLYPAPRPLRPSTQRLIDTSRARFGRDRTEVEEKIR